MSALLTEAQLAERLNLEPKDVTALRRQHRWECVRFGRFKIRYTEAQVEHIVAAHTVKADRPVGLPEQTALSARRSA